MDDKGQLFPLERWISLCNKEQFDVACQAEWNDRDNANVTEKISSLQE